MSSDGIKPTAASLASGRRAKLASQLMKHLRQLRVLGRQGSIAHASGVCLHHTDYSVHPMRRDTSACTGATRSRIRRSHIGIGAMVDIKKCSLRAFKENLFVSLDGAMEIHHRISHERPQFFTGCQITFANLPKTYRLCT